MGENKSNTVIDANHSENVIEIHSNNVTIKYLSIVHGGVERSGIRISDYNNATISHCNISNNRYGIIILNSNNTSISHNIFNFNDSGEQPWNAINIQYCNHCNIINNNITSTGHFAIFLNSGMYNFIRNNILINIKDGIQLSRAMYNTVDNNTISKFGVMGILLYLSHNNEITNNNVSDGGILTNYNHRAGIMLAYENYYNNITNNLLVNNLAYNIWLWGVFSGQGWRVPENNSIWHNNLFDANQALDNGLNNIWNDVYPSGGNYWSDFDEPGEGAWDNNSDGIVDTPYDIPGFGNQDLYPLMYQFGPPFARFQYAAVPQGIQFNASSSGDYDGVIVAYQWDFGDGSTGTGIQVSHTYPANGVYTVTLQVIDDEGRSHSVTEDVSVSNAGGPSGAGNGEPPMQVPVLSPLGLCIMIGLLFLLTALDIQRKN